jgi:hypothetical protein
MSTAVGASPRRSVSTPPAPDGAEGAAAAALVPLWRLYALRAGYLLVGTGLAVTKWPLLVAHQPWSPFEGVSNSMLVAMSVLALWGVRHPLRMLPVMLFEVTWKVVWYAVVAVPLWTSSTMDAANQAFAWDCLLVVPLLAVIPWRHVLAQYVSARGDRWR